MILIADSGSTKTDWCLVGERHQLDFSTQGINPFHQSSLEIQGILQIELVPQLPRESIVDEVFFYGAGCTPEKSPKIVNALQQTFGVDVRVFAGSDVLGAARALCQHAEGIACILGTGANSCYYDGTDIRANVSPLGYILGDEGSAAYIGKRLVGDVLKSQFSQSICSLFYEETHLDGPTIINKVYREAMPNRFLGEISQFCQHHRDLPEIHDFLIDCFLQFFSRNVCNYPQASSLPISFVGSIAWVYEAEISEAASRLNLTVGSIFRAPKEGLVRFHTVQTQ